MNNDQQNQLPPKVERRQPVLDRLIAQQIKQRQAAKLLGLTVRQIRRLTKRYRREGVSGLGSKQVGRPSNNKIPDAIHHHYLDILKTHYADFGPTFAHEKLVEHHGATFSVETLRQWMIADDIWQAHVKPKERQHPLRTRRSCVGELVQIDGSDHLWFENRGDRCTLLVAIDDATSRILGARFVPVESAANYLYLFKEYFQTQGIPVSLYSDRHSIFKVNHKGCEEHETQFSRIVEGLGIELIHAQTPQAKGRVERVFQTLQDRLVKEMRLANMSNIHDANQFLAEYLPKHNEKFSVAPASDTDKHTALALTDHELNKALAFKYDRIVRNDYSISFFGERLELHTHNPASYLRGQHVTVLKLLDHQIIIDYQGHEIHAQSVRTNAMKYMGATSKTLNGMVDNILLDKNNPSQVVTVIPGMTQKTFCFEGCPDP